jgi:hypothetical protein
MFRGLENIALEGSLDKLSVEKVNGILKFEKNGKILHFKVTSSVNTLASSKLELAATSTLFAPKFSRATFVAEYDNAGKTWSIEGGINNEILRFSGQFDFQLDSKRIKASFESTMHGFRKIDMNGAIIKTGVNAYSLNLIGGSADSTNTFNIKANTSPENGEIIVLIKLPFVGIENESYQINYDIHPSRSTGTVAAVFNGSQYKLTWSTTPQGK